ncbi:hypothetical protein EYZ11_008509 [Aspergillus tanneri]|uniref:Ig-like domain-containing protein n=1 Tax=Aspergillus tanneri TaxID=1220188 RepID=A0A4S3JAG2_9EURO|nr:uncharacterized protein ATNIH1004_002860 [Aspergillus tanneri]KAA8650179.1 hypothetical protein ATNIH1004_002860 [Aspergillus tanneri]THC92010.1 hypothetical protein EYZ11_008509 [Aspergillus tanneri]
MKICSVAVASTLAIGALADLHFTRICYDSPASKVQVHRKVATDHVCTWYQNRNTGDEKWDQCLDCTAKTDQDLRYYCQFEGQHIGDELSYYCEKTGAAGSLAWTH